MKKGADIFKGATDMETRTKLFHAWMKSASDDIKRWYAVNWCRVPHTLFNVSCRFFPSEELQDIDWFKIHQSKDLGLWANSDGVAVS